MLRLIRSSQIISQILRRYTFAMNHFSLSVSMTHRARSIGILFGTIALVVSVPAEAQVLRDYRCKIERVAMSDIAVGSRLDFQEKNYLGKEFAVERRTGVMTGALKNSYITRPEVVDAGSDENAYKVVTTLRQEQGAGRGSNAYLLVVNEYAKGSKKPFVFVENDNVYFGSCIHF